MNIGKAILEYSADYYRYYELYAHMPNQKKVYSLYIQGTNYRQSCRYRRYGAVSGWKGLKTFCDRGGWESYKGTDHYFNKK